MQESDDIFQIVGRMERIHVDTEEKIQKVLKILAQLSEIEQFMEDNR